MATYILIAAARLPLPASLGWLSEGQESVLRIGGPLLAVVWAGVVTSSRLSLGHHTVAQVLGGIAFGTSFAVGAFTAWRTYGLEVYGAQAETVIWSWTSR